MFKSVRTIVVIFFVAILALIAFQGYLVVSAKNRGEKVYQIDVNSFNGVETYMTNEYSKDEKTGCITFKDMIGIKRIVCNNYTITEY